MTGGRDVDADGGDVDPVGRQAHLDDVGDEPRETQTAASTRWWTALSSGRSRAGVQAATARGSELWTRTTNGVPVARAATHPISRP